MRPIARITNSVRAISVRRAAGGKPCIAEGISTDRLAAAFEILKDRTVGPVIAFAGGCERLDGITHRDQSLDLGLDLAHMLERKPLHIGAGAGFVLPEIEQPPDAVDRKAEIAGTVNKAQHADIGLRIETVIAVAAAGPLDQTGGLIISDRLGRDARRLCRLADIHKV